MSFPIKVDKTPLAKATHLNIDDLVEPSNQDNAAHFSCIICMQVVLEPQECITCSTLLCKACIAKWLRSNPACPMKCKISPIFGRLERFVACHPRVLDYLNSMKFKCAFSEHGCSELLPYELALKHLKQCRNRTVKCTQHCGLSLQFKDRQDHKKKCQNFKIQCKTCKGNYYPNQAHFVKHVCEENIGNPK